MLSSRHRDIQGKSDRLNNNCITNGNEHPKDHENEYQQLRTSHHNPQIEEVEEFTYLESKVSTDGNSGKGVQARLAKANQAFGSLNAAWKSKELKVKTH